MKQLLTLLLAACSFFARSQVVDQFADGNFSANPEWTGDDSLFQVNSAFSLQSKGTPGTAKDLSLSTPNNLVHDAEWQCWVKFNLNPSTSNFCRFYLVSSQPDLKGNLDGYYVQFGGVTGSTDSITLYKQKGASRMRIIGGRPSTISKTSNVVRVKVLRDHSGHWQLFSDTLGGRHFISEGAGTDSEFVASEYCGYFVRFTSSNASNYFLDDVYAGPPVTDTVPPAIDSLTIVDSATVRLVFSEEVDTSALNPDHYLINNGIGPGIHAIFESAENKIVRLTFANNLVSGTGYTLSANSISDLSNNVLGSQTVPFTYFVPREGDVVVSELMPDPSPPIDLPEQEFAELYNNSAFTINLNGWTWSDGTSVAVLPDVMMEPGGFLIICSSANIPLFSGFGKTTGITGFPSLNNSGDNLVLKDNHGNLIDQVSYTTDWYHDKSKAGGGWSLEMKNPSERCKKKNNFSASTDPTGGTPGKQNSAWSILPDLAPPVITGLVTPSPDRIILSFDGNMDSLSLVTATIQITNGIGISGRIVKGEAFDSLELLVNPMLTANTPYFITVDQAKDCSHNALSNVRKAFTYFLPDTAQAYDVVINELMADPDPSVGLPAYEFAELYNKSSRIISLKNWTLEDQVSKATFPDLLIFPDSFIIVTTTSALPAFSSFGSPVALTGFPSLGNDGDLLVLKNEKGQVVHAINYSSDWYHDNVKKNGGWSLEMIDPENPCTGKENWSASTNKKGGTPGKKNTALAVNRDTRPPSLLNAYPLNTKEIRLSFSEPLDSAALRNKGVIYINTLPGHAELKLQPPFYQSFIAQFADSFRLRNVYRLLIDSITDCAGNKIAENDYTDFGIPEPFDSSEVVINEVLFNPRSGGVDFVELYNRTSKVIDPGKLFIANANEDNTVNDLYPVAESGFLLFPYSYCVLTTDPTVLAQQYFSSNTRSFIRNTLPSFNDDKGTVILLDAQSRRYDQLNYDDNMHFPLLDNKDGVSLERIDFNRPTADRSNWTSAAMGVSATPAYRNSQYVTTDAAGHHLDIEPEVFSPDGDGYKDVVNFSWSFNESGYTGNLFIFDSRGIAVKHLLKNALLGTTGTYSWNGVNEKNEKAGTGIYIAYFEVFNLEGEVANYRSTFVLGGKL